MRRVLSRVTSVFLDWLVPKILRETAGRFYRISGSVSKVLIPKLKVELELNFAEQVFCWSSFQGVFFVNADLQVQIMLRRQSQKSRRHHHRRIFLKALVCTCSLFQCLNFNEDGNPSVRLPRLLPHDGEESRLASPPFIITLQPVSDLHVALYSYSSNEQGDLSFNQGEYINVVKRDGDWWTGTVGDRSGIFPANYVKKIESPQVPQPVFFSENSAIFPAPKRSLFLHTDLILTLAKFSQE